MPTIVTLGFSALFLVIVLVGLGVHALDGRIDRLEAKQRAGDGYPGCLIENLRGVGNDLAARGIIASCRRLHPDRPVGPDVEDIMPSVQPMSDPRVDPQEPWWEGFPLWQVPAPAD